MGLIPHRQECPSYSVRIGDRTHPHPNSNPRTSFNTKKKKIREHPCGLNFAQTLTGLTQLSHDSDGAVHSLLYYYLNNHQ